MISIGFHDKRRDALIFARIILMFKLKNFLIVMLMMGVLTACKSREERAEEYYQSALTLLEEGDTERALIELRNVFDNNGLHREARQLYADLVLARGDAQEAYGQYLRLVEQYPDAVEVRLQLAELALDLGNWEEVKRHGGAAIELAPEVPAHQALEIFIRYQEARQRQDDVAAGEVVREAETLLETHPDLSTALRILVEWHATSPEPARALPYLDQLLAQFPNARSLLMARLGILQQAGMSEEIGPQLHQIYDRFPEDPVIVDLMIKWYQSRGDFETLEAFLRERAGPVDGNFEGHMTVVALLAQTQGQEAALAELVQLAKANEDSDLGRQYLLQQMQLRFQAGEHEASMAEVAEIIAQGQDPDLVNEARMSLSRMKAATGDQEEARRLVAAVLESDASNVPALSAQAAWHIREDKLSEAITGLRHALDQEPRNANTLLLLAEAQQKMGNVELAEQRLAQAVEITNGAPREALIYARFQIARGQLAAADRVLTDSFSANGNLEVARLLGQVLLRRGDFEGAQGILETLANSQNPNAAPLARSMQAALLFNQNRLEEGFAFLRSSVEEGDADSEFITSLQILRVQMMTGRLEDARNQIAAMHVQFPDNLALRMLEGNLYALEGKQDEAIKIYQALHEENPEQPVVLQRLYAALREIGRGEEASGLLAAALERQPDLPPLLMLRAVELEEQLQGEEAIAIYEKLYAADPGDLITANNLASMLATHRSSEEDLKRAYTIAQRLNGTTIPAMLDTLGWVQYLNEETDAAILNLQAATRGLPGNPTVAFNLAHAYAQAGRNEEALAELQRGFDLAGDDETVPQLARARELREKLGG